MNLQPLENADVIYERPHTGSLKTKANSAFPSFSFFAPSQHPGEQNYGYEIGILSKNRIWILSENCNFSTFHNSMLISNVYKYCTPRFVIGVKSTMNVSRLWEYIQVLHPCIPPIYLHLIFAILQIEISSLMNLIFSLPISNLSFTSYTRQKNSSSN